MHSTQQFVQCHCHHFQYITIQELFFFHCFLAVLMISMYLQQTPDGTVKVIERFDCSGCGDVDMSKKITASTDGTIIGLSGRKIKVSMISIA